ncbi:energy transducer TonB [Mucilaginibacter pedocola]|uniref:TonB C-terminal domain-containing protein n=1 Tax=Mucilaginibacter pedocola TaxID=1792845 RepID=A0A1S9PJI6_9SPHI|nr:energy transducer TonB [Mucilaginibacter pedocola]OOQ61106.1 hypothetical protein BC343_21940 [Mucilaginibacter pedocola]
MKYLIALSFILISFTTALQAQTIAYRKVTGKITDITNKPLAGYSISLFGGTIGTTTDRAGKFSFVFPNDRPVLISIDNKQDPQVVVKVSPQQKALDIQLNDLTSAYSAQYIAEWNKKKAYNQAHAMDAYTTPEYKKFSAPEIPRGSFADVRIDEPIGAGDPVITVDRTVDPKRIYTAVEEQPKFNGNWEKYVADNLKMPASAKENNVQGRVILSYVVEKDGSLTDIKVIRGISTDCDKEATRVVSASPKWIPGKMNGQAVRTQYSIPIHFKLEP